MLFNSLEFFCLLAVVYHGYWLMRRAPLAAQNLWLLIASYFFYGWWDWRFLSLLIFSSAVDYTVGLSLDRARGDAARRKVLLGISILCNLGLLGFFKYYNFFAESFADALRALGLHADMRTLNVILPVGISFYTFQTLSYTIDIYREKISPTRNIVAFFAFVSFFPQLVAGPIERAANLLPQFLERRRFDAAVARDGLRQILWGFVKKVLIADNLAWHVDWVYSNYPQMDGLSIALGTFFFAIQIYCDFSGYSDIAIGVARLFGFNLMRNFAYPYFSRDISEFWRRWHISLSTWFRDYVYIPLGGNHASRARHILNVLVTFTLSGLWHGANWTFVIWGMLHSIYYLVLMLRGHHKRYTGPVAEGRWLPGGRELLGMISTFLLVLLAWVFFRADSLGHALAMLQRFCLYPLMLSEAPPAGSGFAMLLSWPLLGIVGLTAAEWLQRSRQHALQIEHLPRWFRWTAYYILLILILLYGNLDYVPFIYFQF